MSVLQYWSEMDVVDSKIWFFFEVIHRIESYFLAALVSKSLNLVILNAVIISLRIYPL